MTVANTLAYYDTATITAVISYTIHAPEGGGQTQGPFTFFREGNIYEWQPKSCLGQVFNFKLGSLTDNTINPLNANDHF